VSPSRIHYPSTLVLLALPNFAFVFLLLVLLSPVHGCFLHSTLFVAVLVFEYLCVWGGEGMRVCR
jgi:hypothetical protein